MSTGNDTQFYHFSNRQAGRIMCFVGGYIDIVGFVLLYLIFVASITGNIVKFARAVDEGIFSVSFFVVSVAFGVGSIIAKLLHMFLKSFPSIQDQHIVCIFFAVEVVLLFVPMVVGGCYQDVIANESTADSGIVLGVGILLAIAMGFQNLSSGMVLKGFPNTTGMTATIALAFSVTSQVTLLYLALNDCVSWGLTYSEEQALHEASMKSSPETSMSTLHTAKRALLEVKLSAASDELCKQWGILLSFIIGAIIGGAIVLQISFWSIAICIFICAFMSLEAYWQLLENKNIRKLSAKASKILPNSMSVNVSPGLYGNDSLLEGRDVDRSDADGEAVEMIGIDIGIGSDRVAEEELDLNDEKSELYSASSVPLREPTPTLPSPVVSPARITQSLFPESVKSSQRTPPRVSVLYSEDRQIENNDADDDDDVFGVASFSSIPAEQRMTLSRLLRSLRPNEYNSLVQSLIVNRDHRSRDRGRSRSRSRSRSNSGSGKDGTLGGPTRSVFYTRGGKDGSRKSPSMEQSLAALNADSIVLQSDSSNLDAPLSHTQPTDDNNSRSRALSVSVMDRLKQAWGRQPDRSGVDMNSPSVEGTNYKDMANNDSKPNIIETSQVNADVSRATNAYLTLSPAMRSAVMQSHNIQRKYDNVDLDYNI